MMGRMRWCNVTLGRLCRSNIHAVLIGGGVYEVRKICTISKNPSFLHTMTAAVVHPGIVVTTNSRLSCG